MANTLGVYDPIFYAQEALIQLEENMGMASRVYRSLDRTPQDRGSTTKIRRPSSFTATDMPVSASNLNTETVTLALDKWKGVTFELTDLELAYTRERIVDEHIRPAAVAVANAIDVSLCSLANQFPYRVAGTAAASLTGVGDLPDLQKVLFDNKVPMDDNWHLMFDGERTAAYQNLGTFHQVNTGANGFEVQTRGNLGKKLNFNIFSNQNVQATATGSALTIGTSLDVYAAAALGATSIQITDTTGSPSLSGTLKAGSIVTIGDYSYATAADATAGSNILTLTLTSPLKAAIAEDDVVTLHQNTTSMKQSFAFHRNGLALAMAPLPDLGNNRGAQIATVSDPVTNLSLRARIWYDGDTAKVKVGIDALWGVVMLDPFMGVRYEVAA